MLQKVVKNSYIHVRTQYSVDPGHTPSPHSHQYLLYTYLNKSQKVAENLYKARQKASRLKDL